MKGLFFGAYYATKGVFQSLGVLVIYAPITAWCKPNFQSVFHVLPGQCCDTTDWNNWFYRCCKEVPLLTTMVKVEFAVYAPLFYEFLNSML